MYLMNLPRTINFLETTSPVSVRSTRSTASSIQSTAKMVTQDTDMDSVDMEEKEKEKEKEKEEQKVKTYNLQSYK